MCIVRVLVHTLTLYSIYVTWYHGIAETKKLELMLNRSLTKSIGSAIRVAVEPLTPSRTIAIYNVEYKDSDLEEALQLFMEDTAPSRLGISTITPIANTQWLDNPPRLLLEFSDYRGIPTCMKSDSI